MRSFITIRQDRASTAELKQRYFAGDDDWLVESGSVLDTQYLSRLGQFDVVYSWECYIIRGTCGRRWRMLRHWSSREGSFSSQFITSNPFFLPIGRS